MRSIPSWILPILVAGLLGACAGPRPDAEPAPPGAPWVSEHQRSHPLTGRIWQVDEGRFVDAGAVLDAMTAARFVLLGEKHDNVDHHELQAWLLERLIARGRAPAVAFEMFTMDQEPALAAHLAANPEDASGIGAAVGWEATGWPDWETYQPIAEAALESGAPLRAANLPRATIRALAKEGTEALGSGRAETLGLDRPLPAPLETNLRHDIMDSHCGQLPDAMVGAMVTVMTARDAHMADVLLRGAEDTGRDGAVLITGNGHARNDRGVPYHLRGRQPDAGVVSLGLMEVSADSTEPGAYAARFQGNGLPFDFVWFTPVADQEDPCAKFADQLRKARERHEQETQPTQ